MEAYGRPATSAPEDKLRAELHRLLSAAAAVPGLIHGNAGVGRIFEFRLEPHRGTALGYESAIVHAAIM